MRFDGLRVRSSCQLIRPRGRGVLRAVPYLPRVGGAKAPSFCEAAFGATASRSALPNKKFGRANRGFGRLDVAGILLTHCLETGRPIVCTSLTVPLVADPTFKVGYTLDHPLVCLPSPVHQPTRCNNLARWVCVCCRTLKGT